MQPYLQQRDVRKLFEIEAFLLPVASTLLTLVYPRRRGHRYAEPVAHEHDDVFGDVVVLLRLEYGLQGVVALVEPILFICQSHVLIFYFFFFCRNRTNDSLEKKNWLHLLRSLAGRRGCNWPRRSLPKEQMS